LAVVKYLAKSGLNHAAKAAWSDTAGKPPLFFWCRGQHLRGSVSEAAQAAVKELLESKLELNHNRMRRVLRVIIVPTLSKRKRMVPTWARARSVPFRPMRRSASKST
jgi:hypothetical protein